jgi:biopolymer transport protein ExbD
MAMSVPGGGADEGAPMADINTTPLVDVMLVLLIIFILTVPVLTHFVPVDLPKATNEATVTKPENVNLSIDFGGRVYWNDQALPNMQTLVDRLHAIAIATPQPAVHIRADKRTKYEYVGRVLILTQKSGILKVAFITEPNLRAGTTG